MSAPQLSSTLGAASREATEATYAQWRALVDRALGGVAFETLISKTYDDIAIDPLYSPAADNGLRARAGAWRVLSRLDHPNRDALFFQGRADLAGGADGLVLVCAASPCAFGFGLADWSRETAERFYGDVEAPPHASLELDLFGDAGAAADALLNWATPNVRGDWTDLRFILNPARVDLTSVCALAVDLSESGRVAGVFCADGRRVHAAGGSEAQELAVVLASGVLALRGLEQAGATLERARELLSFRLVADADFFLTIAKMRALRVLWARVEQACGLSPRPIRIVAETAWRMMTRRDPWTNVLRTAIATSAAALGGADAIMVLPFTQAIGLPDAAARRLARNTQLILLHEAHLAKSADPAAGAGAFEALTHSLGARAWAVFQQIEREGGCLGARENGFVQKQVAAVCAMRRDSVARRLETIVGTSDYADLAERLPATIGAPLERADWEDDNDLPLMRLAEPFERLRDRSDAHLLEKGLRPRVFVAGIGSAAGAAESVVFAKSFFEAGGLEAIVREDFAVANASADFAASSARIGCLCPAPDASIERIAAAARALVSAGARIVYMCGEPGANEAVFRDAGVGDFVTSRCDALAVLNNAHACDA